MNILQLNRLLPGLSRALRTEFNYAASRILCESDGFYSPPSSPFRVCWYGSAGYDKRVVDLFNGPRSIVGFSVSVFFFTDTFFFGHFEPSIGTDSRVLHNCFFISSQGPRPVRACIFGKGLLGLDIGTSDQLFEEKVIALGLQIDVACHAGGMAGPGPQDLASLKAQYTLGFTPRWHGDARDGSAKPFGSRVVKEVTWGLSHDREAVSELRRVLTSSGDRVECASESAASFFCAPSYGNVLNLSFLSELSPVAARRFAEVAYDIDLSGLSVIEDSAANAISRHPRALRLDGLKSLTKVTACFLSQKNGALHLDGLRELTPRIAVILSEKVGLLSLGGLDEISCELAEILARHKGTLALNGVRLLSEASAKLLANHDGQLQLGSLENIDDSVAEQLERIPSLLLKQDWDGVITTRLAKVLAKLDNTGLKVDFDGHCSDEVFSILTQFAGHLSVGASTRVTTSMLLILAAGTPAQVSFEKIPQWTHLEEIHAKVLSTSCWPFVIDLDGVESVSESAAAFLVGVRHHFENQHLLCSWLQQLSVIGESQAKLLLKITSDGGCCSFTFDQMADLSPPIAAILAASGRDLSFPAVETLDWQTAKSLASSTSSLSLTGLVDVSPETAEALAEHHGMLNLDGLTNLNVEVAARLANHAGLLSLKGITMLSPQAAEALEMHQGPIMWHRLEVTHPSIARCMVVCRRGPLNLDFLEGLTADTAAVLAEARCELSLSGLTELSDSCALALSQHRGPLRLKGLTHLTAESAIALGRHRGPLYLSGIRTLSPECAAGLSQHTGAIYLTGLQHIDCKSAAAFSTFTGPLYIKNLANLSPDCRRVLEAKTGYPADLPKSDPQEGLDGKDMLSNLP